MSYPYEGSAQPVSSTGDGGGRLLTGLVAQPTMFRTAAVPQEQAQENEFLHQRVDQLERTRENLEQQLDQYRNQPASTDVDISLLQSRLRDAEESEALALQAHETRVRQITALEQQLLSGGQENNGRMLELQRQLEAAKASEAAHRRKVEEQAAQLQEHAMEIQRSKNLQGAMNDRERTQLENQFAAAHRETENQARIAQQQSSELLRSKAVQTRDMREMEQQIDTLKKMEDAYQQQLQEDRKTIGDLHAQLERGGQSTDFHAGQHQPHAAHVKNLEAEVSYLKSVETFHSKQSDLHRKEVKRLKRLRDEDAPPPVVPRMPLKALEERVMHLALFTMMGVTALPIMGAIALLSDQNYVFWLGRTWPLIIIGGCVSVFVVFAYTVQGLYQWASPEHRSQFTMAFTWATFAALLGVTLVPMSLMANKETLRVASTISQGCMTAYPQSELLVDYSQVLYNIRLSANCSGAKSVTECNGWAANQYTTYLHYLENDFHCGPLCPESPPPGSAVYAPSLHNSIPTLKPSAIPGPPLVGPPLQAALGNGVFLQAVREHVQVLPRSAGIMETALPHMQARKLFSEGKTRATCYPLIATRLQVLVSTFGGLWYWEGMGLIIISLLTSLYAGMYFAFGGVA